MERRNDTRVEGIFLLSGRENSNLETQKTVSSAQIQSFSDDSEAAYLLRPFAFVGDNRDPLSLTVSAALEAFALNKSNKNANN